MQAALVYALAAFHGQNGIGAGGSRYMLCSRLMLVWGPNHAATAHAGRNIAWGINNLVWELPR